MKQAQLVAEKSFRGIKSEQLETHQHIAPTVPPSQGKFQFLSCVPRPSSKPTSPPYPHEGPRQALPRNGEKSAELGPLYPFSFKPSFTSFLALAEDG